MKTRCGRPRRWRGSRRNWPSFRSSGTSRCAILPYGLLEPRNPLDIVRNFVVFEVDGGRTVRKLTRYKQFIAVNEALRRIRKARNPVFYQSLRERLEEIIEQRRQERLDAAEQLKLLNDLREDLKGEQSRAAEMELDARGFAIYGLLEKQRPRRVRDRTSTYDAANRDLASLIDEAVTPFTDLVDWQQKDHVQRQMRSQIKRRTETAHPVRRGRRRERWRNPPPDLQLEPAERFDDRLPTRPALNGAAVAGAG